LEQRAITALLVAFRGSLISDRRLRHFRRGISHWEQRDDRSRCTGDTAKKSGSSGKSARLILRFFCHVSVFCQPESISLSLSSNSTKM
jgi:hypothetical protein